jgi:hypothetical protein
MKAMNVGSTKFNKMINMKGFPRKTRGGRYDLQAVDSWCASNDEFIAPDSIRPNFTAWLRKTIEPPLISPPTTNPGR